ASEELSLSKQKFQIDSSLYSQNVVSYIDFIKEKYAWLEQIRTFNNASVSVISNEIQLKQIEKQITELKLTKTEQHEKLSLSVDNLKKKLIAHIAQWKQNYLITAPSTGKIAYLGFLKNNDFIEGATPLFSIIQL